VIEHGVIEPAVHEGPDGWWVEVVDGDSAALVSGLAAGTSGLVTGTTVGHGVRVGRLRGVWRGGPAPAAPTETPITVDQTQYSVIVGGVGSGDAVVVKWTVHPTASASPAPRRTVHLAEVGFTEQPAPLGEVYLDADFGTPVLLAAVTSHLPGARDGWDFYVEDVRSYARGDAVDVLAAARHLGGLVARMHNALATPSSLERHPGGTADAARVRTWHQRALDTLEEALALTGGPEGERLRALAPKARASLAVLSEVDSTPVQPVHGDLHVGQVLRWEGGYAVNDFDGNPVLPPAERLAPQPTARDVAGMLASLDHVGRVALRHAPDADASRVEAWIATAHETFLASYLETLGADADRFDERLLAPFAVEQECREYVYAARHLPRWLYVPDAALPALLG